MKSLTLALLLFVGMNAHGLKVPSQLVRPMKPLNSKPNLPLSWTASQCIELGCHFSCEVEADGQTCKPQGVFKCDCGGGWIKVGGCSGY